MKLRQIDTRNWVDDETGTYFEFFSDTDEATAYEQAEMRVRQMLRLAPADEVYGTKIRCPRQRKMRLPPKWRPEP